MKKSVNIIYMLMFVLCFTALTACGGDDEPESSNRKIIKIDGHEAVDLGLSVKWATCNLGSFSETNVGTKYLFSTHPHNNTEDYVLYDPYSNSDLVSKTWGDKWRLPTSEEMDELMQKCIFEIVFYNGEKIVKLTASNGNYIYLPYYPTTYGEETYFISSSMTSTSMFGDESIGMCIDNRRICKSSTVIDLMNSSSYVPIPHFIRPVAK